MHSGFKGISPMAVAIVLAQAAPAQAHAQDVPPASAANADASGGQAPSAVPDSASLPPAIASTKRHDQDQAADSGAIVVTGSRLPSEFSITTPVQVIKSSSAAVMGNATVAEMVARATAAQGTQQVNNQLSATGAGGSVVLGGANVNTIGLRNLSATRTLTLLNGQRIAPSGTGSQVAPVDYNVIPSVAVDRVEVVTTGASSVYGSDAIAGVINVVTRKGGNGLELTAFSRLPEKTGGRYVDVSAYWGRNYDNFYVSAAVEYDHQFELNMKDRAATACAQDFAYDPTSGKRIDAVDKSGNFRCFNHNPTGIFFDQYFYGGAFILDPTQAGGPYPAAARNLQRPGDPLAAPLMNWVRANRGGFPDTFSYSQNTSKAYDESDSISPYQRLNAYVSAGVDAGGNAELYFNALYSHRKSESNSWSFLYPFLSATNPNNTVGAALQYVSGGASSGDIGPQVVRPYHAEQRVDFFQSSLGLRGKFTGGLLKNWNFDANMRVGLSRGTYGQTFYYQDRINAATAPGVACDPSLITISGPTNCVSIPWLSKRFLVDQNWTQAETDFLQGYEEGKTRYDQFAVEATLSGTVLNLPAGNVSAVVGGTIRSDYLDDNPGYNARNHNYFSFSTAGRTSGSDTVREVYGELGVPVLADLPFIKSLRMTASGRYTDYASYGSNGTYRVAGAWEVASPLAFRASYGTSFRAPSIYELNLAQQSSFFNYFDPCMRYGDSSNPNVVANCKAEGFAPDFAPNNTGITGISGGGKGRLKAETSTSFNAGVVFHPRFANFNISVDYYDIKVKNEVTTFGVTNIVNSCYSLTGAARESFCSLITRDPNTQAITSVNNSYLNLASQRTRGIDFAVSWSAPLGRDVNLGLDVRGSRTLENTVQRDFLSPVQEQNGLSGFPKLTGYAEAQLRVKSVAWFLGGNYIGAVDDTPYYQQQGAFIPGTTNFAFYGAYAGRNQYGNGNDFATVKELLHVPAQVTVYTSIRWQVRPKTTLLAGVNNLFDKQPPVIGPDAYTYRIGSVAGNQYNYIGRTFFMRLNQSL